jgi:hypothetical protein
VTRSMLHVHVHAACPRPCYMSISMLHVSKRDTDNVSILRISSVLKKLGGLVDKKILWSCTGYRCLIGGMVFYSDQRGFGLAQYMALKPVQNKLLHYFRRKNG